MFILASEITGLILTGGQGTRVAGSDKGLLQYQQTTLVERQLKWFAPHVNSVIISANRHLEQYEHFAQPIVTDHYSESRGPLAGIEAALAICKTTWMFVLPVDMPDLPSDLISKITSTQYSEAPAFYLVSNKREHHLSMLIRCDNKQELSDFLQKDNYRVRDFLKHINARPLDLELPESVFTNLNYPENYI